MTVLRTIKQVKKKEMKKVLYWDLFQVKFLVFKTKVEASVKKYSPIVFFLPADNMSRFLFSLLCVISFIFLQKSSISVSNQMNDIVNTSVRLVLSTSCLVCSVRLVLSTSCLVCSHHLWFWEHRWNIKNSRKSFKCDQEEGLKLPVSLFPSSNWLALQTMCVYTVMIEFNCFQISS